MSPEHQVRHFPNILPNLIVASDGFPEYNNIIESNCGEDAGTGPNSGPRENSPAAETCWEDLGVLDG